MKKMAEKDNYSCVVLGPGDFKIFADARVKCWRDKKADPANLEQLADSEIDQVLRAIDKEGEDYWRDLFSCPGQTYFVLLERTPEGREHSIGMADIAHFGEQHGDCAYFGTAHVLAAYRRQGLSNLLYEARLKYVLEETDHHQVLLGILDGNEPSIRAAERNGFALSYRMDKEGSTRFMYRRDISDLRAAPVQHPTSTLDIGEPA